MSKKYLAILLIGALGSGTATATGVFYDSGTTKNTAPASNVIAPTTASTLSSRFTQHAPIGWTLKAPDTVRNIPVDWQEKTPWFGALDEIGQKHSIAFEIDKQNKTVIARHKAKTHTASSGPGNKITSSKKTGNTNTAWRIQKGKSLRENLSSWVRKAGWQDLIWSAHVDYPVIASATYYAPDIESAVRQLAATIKHTQAPLKFTAASNKVLRVSGGKEYQQTR